MNYVVASHSPLFNHLIGAKPNRRGDCKAKCLGGLQVHDHPKFCRQLNGQLRRLRAAQDAIDISGGATKDVYRVLRAASRRLWQSQIANRPPVRCFEPPPI